jgi:hypothetical protein
VERNSILIGAIILVVIALAVGGMLLFSAEGTSDGNKANVTNTTNITHSANTTNSTGLNLTNATGLKSNEESESQSSSSSSPESDPEYGSDEYVKRWDESERSDGDSWSYLHDQPVKTEDGHKYKRMYNPDTDEGYWYQMDQNFDFSSNEEPADDSSDSQNDDSSQD